MTACMTFRVPELLKHVCINFPPLKLEVECVIVAVRTARAELYLYILLTRVWTVRQSCFYYDCV